MINFSNDTPDWIKELVRWAVMLVAPEWDINVLMAKIVDADIPHCKGAIEIENGYLRCDITYQTDLENNVKGNEDVLHEICHLLTEPTSKCAENLVTSKMVRATALKNYEHLEEELVVRFTRILLKLREGRINGAVKTS
jgi:hypothetical protein